MIAHRLATLRTVDLVLRVEDGKVVAETPQPVPTLAVAA
jgi:ABC-type multidrug transport system fused ATPase/permease subunit